MPQPPTANAFTLLYTILAVSFCLHLLSFTLYHQHWSTPDSPRSTVQVHRCVVPLYIRPPSGSLRRASHPTVSHCVQLISSFFSHLYSFSHALSILSNHHWYQVDPSTLTRSWLLLSFLSLPSGPLTHSVTNILFFVPYNHLDPYTGCSNCCTIPVSGLIHVSTAELRYGPEPYAHRKVYGRSHIQYGRHP